LTDTQDAGVVDQDVDATPLVDGRLDDLAALEVRVIVGDRLGWTSVSSVSEGSTDRRCRSAA